MKKTSFLVILSIFLVNVTLKAQTEKGKVLLGGTINPKFYSSESTYDYSGNIDPTLIGTPFDTKANFWNISSNLKGGYFFLNNFAVGLNINESFFLNKYRFDHKISSFILTGGPFLRGYPIKKERFGLFLEGGGNLGFGKTSRHYGSTVHYKSNSILFTTYAGPGINFFITEKAGIEVSVFYNYREEKYKNTGFMFDPLTFNGGSHSHKINAMIGINLFL